MEENKKDLRVFQAFEEQEEERRNYWRGLRPMERMTTLKDLIIKSYNLTPEKLSNPKLGNTLTIRKFK